jgi:hypothetical protein
MKNTMLVLITTSVGVSACTTSVDLQYARPPEHGNLAAIAKQADDHYEYVELSDVYVKVAPDTAETKPKADEAVKPAGSTGTPVNRPQATAAQTQTTAPAARAQNPASNKKGVKSPSAAAAPKAQPGSTTPKPAAGSTDTNTAAPPKANPLDPALSMTTIDGKKWAATVVPVPSSDYGFMVRGVSSFWRSTTISISRYDNSNIASSVSSKAENLVAKRLGQFAGAAASIVKVGAALGVADVAKPPSKPLLPFSIKIPASNDNGKLNDGWTWGFEYDSSDKPAGTVTFSDFMTQVALKTVGYWPVPACRSGILTVFPPTKDPVPYQYLFNVVVSTPQYVRLQSVPINGKLSPGVVCSASETGTTTDDPLQTLSDDFTALQQGIDKVKAAKKGKTAEPSTKSGADPATDAGKP